MRQHRKGWKEAFLKTDVQQLQRELLTLCSALGWAKSDHAPPPSQPPIPPTLVLPQGSFQHIHPSLISYIHPSALLLPHPLVTILKGTLLVYYTPYVTLKHMFKTQRFGKNTSLRKSLIGKGPLNICRTTAGRNRGTGLLQNLKSSL